jgi:hypothetical protein
LDPIDVVSPYAYTLEKPNCHTGKIVVENNDVNFMLTEMGETELPKITGFRTFITQNPDFKKDILTLKSLKSLAWQFPSVAVSVIGTKYDRDIISKIKLLREYLREINAHYGEDLVGKVVGPIIKEMPMEYSDGTIIDTIITDQYAKLLLPPELLKGKIQSMPSNIIGARAITISHGMGSR